MVSWGSKVTPKYRCRGVHFPRSSTQGGATFCTGDVGVVSNLLPPTKNGYPYVAIVRYRGEEFGIHVTDLVEVRL